MTRFTLLVELTRYGYHNTPDSPFTLASGEMSPEYMDCRTALARPHVLEAAAQLVSEELTCLVHGVGGLTMGADALAVALCLRSMRSAQRLLWFSIRKEPKDHGFAAGQGVVSRFVGALRPADHVAVLDDTVTTGASTINAIRACREANISVRQVVVLLDRQQGGMGAIQAELDAAAGNRAKASALFTLEEVRAAWRHLHPEISE